MSPNLVNSAQSAPTLTLNNIMTGTIVVDGKTLGQIAFKNIDRNVRLAFGS